VNTRSGPVRNHRTAGATALTGAGDAGLELSHLHLCGAAWGWMAWVMFRLRIGVKKKGICLENTIGYCFVGVAFSCLAE